LSQKEEGLKIKKVKRRAFMGYKGSLWYLILLKKSKASSKFAVIKTRKNGR
jgi:hypothetical protein